MLGLLMLVSHQNCTPAQLNGKLENQGGEYVVQNPEQNPEQRPEPAMPVTIIDDSKSQANLSFTFSEVEVASQNQDVSLLGVCSLEQEGATLNWKVSRLDANEKPIEEVVAGQSGCSSGEFRVELVAAPNRLPCGFRYQVLAQLGYGQPGVAIISSVCNVNASN